MADPATATLVVTALGVGLQAYQGEEQRQSQSKSLRRQDKAQGEAKRAAVSERRRADMAEAQANRQQPDVSSLLGAERARARSGPGATLLTGASGIRSRNLLLGGQQKLGG